MDEYQDNMSQQDMHKTKEYQLMILKELEDSEDRISEKKGLEYNVDGCACPPCGCQKSPYTFVLSPVGIAAAGGALVATSPL